jgi:hypothetical protein
MPILLQACTWSALIALHILAPAILHVGLPMGHDHVHEKAIIAPQSLNHTSACNHAMLEQTIERKGLLPCY